MNPMIFIGLGAVALMAMGGKKKTAPEDSSDEYDDPGQGSVGEPTFMVAKKTTMGTAKRVVATKLPPLNYQSMAQSQASVSQAKACHLQGMNDLNEITMCIAKKIFPGWDWTKRIGWQQDAWSHMMNISRVEMGLGPLVP